MSAPTDVWARVSAEQYLCLADRVLGQPLVGLYLVGSAALGAFHPGRSDVDVVAVVGDGSIGSRSIARLRVLHLAAGGIGAVGGIRA